VLPEIVFLSEKNKEMVFVEQVTSLLSIIYLLVLIANSLE
jgi:hypothetical protein